VLPTLVVNYFGQAALLLARPETAVNPFFHLAPAWGRYPLVCLSTMAAVIASQAIIFGGLLDDPAAVQLGYSPRFDIQHTSAHEKGQVYIPEINWLLMVATVGLVLGFRSSTKPRAAYGMAVTTTIGDHEQSSRMSSRASVALERLARGGSDGGLSFARPGLPWGQPDQNPARRVVPAGRRGRV